MYVIFCSAAFSLCDYCPLWLIEENTDCSHGRLCTSPRNAVAQLTTLGAGQVVHSEFIRAGG